MADVVVTITVPESYIQRALDALARLENSKLNCDVRKSLGAGPEHLKTHSHGRFSFEIPEQGELTSVEFFKLILIRYFMGAIEMTEQEAIDAAHLVTLAAVEKPELDVPEDILQ